MAITTGTKEGGELKNEAKQFGVGGRADADAAALGGAGLVGGEGGPGAAFGGLADAGVAQGLLQGGVAEGAEDNTVSNVISIS
ncbi:MAG: hypothetical protein ACREYC_06105 [Gammaproteobacteria bacterium]